MVGENFLCPSSKAKIKPVKGALKATAKPAEAPDVIESLFHALLLQRIFSSTALTLLPTSPPNWTEGPSLPKGNPAKKVMKL